MNNENNPHLLVIPLGSLAADKVVPAGYLPKKSVIVGLALQNGAAIAQSDTNYAVVNLKVGSQIIGSVSTQLTGGQGPLVALQPLAGAIVAGQEVQAAGAALSAQYDETDAGSNVALTDALLIVQYYPL